HRAGLAAMLAREQAARDRVVRDHAQTFLGAQREELALDLAEEQVVAGLHAVEARQTEVLAAPERAGDLIREVVRAADVARLGAADGAEVAADGVDVGRVEEGDAAGRGPIENRDGGRLVALQAEGHGSQTELRDPQPRAAETNVPHRGLTSSPSWCSGKRRRR